MANEKWATVPKTQGRYSISTMGRIRSHDTVIVRMNQGHKQSILLKGRVLKPTLGNNGYYYVSLVRDGEKKKYYIHRLMLETFVGDEPNMEVNHKNGVRSDNRLSNLEWVTGKGNMQHSVYTLGHTGRLAASMRRVKCVDTGKVFPSISAAARSQNVSPSRMKAACDNKTPIRGREWVILDKPNKTGPLVEQSRKPVLCVETGEVFRSLTEAAENVDRCISALSQAISGKSHSCAGYHWEWA